MPSITKKIMLGDSSLSFLDIIAGEHGTTELPLSSAVNLCVQFCSLVAQQKLPLTTAELLFCCDICNGGAHLTEFKTPDSVSISQALESLQFTLVDAAQNNYGGELEKWNVNAARFVKLLNTFTACNLFTLAIATRQFWARQELPGYKCPSDCKDYQEWAAQWCRDV